MYGQPVADLEALILKEMLSTLKWHFLFHVISPVPAEQCFISDIVAEQDYKRIFATNVSSSLLPLRATSTSKLYLRP